MWTMGDAINNEQDPLRLGVLQVFLMESNPMGLIPWESINRLKITVTRITRTSLTKPGWVKIGAAYSEATPSFDSLEETVYKIGRDIDTPIEYENMDGQFEDLRSLGTEAALKAFAYEFNEAFVNGPMINSDGSNNPDALIGIRERVDAVDALGGALADAKQNPAGDVNGTPVGPTGDATSLNAALDALNSTMYFIDGHQPDWGITNQSLLLAMESAFRRLGLFADSRDSYERFVHTYRGVPVYDIGLKADQSTKIIGDDEKTADGTSASNATSLYWGKNGVKTHFHGWEMKPLDVRDIGELEGTPVVRTRVDWLVGLANWHPRCLSRVHSLQALT